MANPKYQSVSLTEDLVDRIDDFLMTNRWGYRSRPEVIAAAVREFLRNAAAMDESANTREEQLKREIRALADKVAHLRDEEENARRQARE